MRTIIFISFFIGALANAEPVGLCERNPKTQKYTSTFIEGLTKQIANSQDPILALYREEQKGRKATAEQSPTPGPENALRDLQNIALAVLTEDAFPKNCVTASMLSHSYAESFYCPDKGARRIAEVREEKCVSQEQVDYTFWLVNKVYSCFNNPEDPLDPRLVFLKLNNESGFDHTLCSSAGCGLGQLTPPAVKQMGQKRGIEYFIPKDVASIIDQMPGKTGCGEFVNLIYPEQKRINTYRGFAESTLGEKCKLLHPGQGAAVNAMYSLGYLKYLTRRDGELKDSLALIDNARAEAAKNLLFIAAEQEKAQTAFDKKPNKKNTDTLAVMNAKLKSAQEAEGELADARWEQYLLMAAYNQGAGGAGAAKVNGSFAKNGVYKALAANLSQVGKGKKPIKRYIAAVASRLRSVAGGQEPYTEQVFQVKREQVLENGQRYGLEACSLAQDIDTEGLLVPLAPIASTDLTLKPTGRLPAASSESRGKN